MNVSIFIKCKPPSVTSQTGGKRMRWNGAGKKPTFFPKGEAEAAERTYEALLEKHQPAAPVPGPVHLSIEFVWPWRKSDLGTRAKKADCDARGRQWFESKPDYDNIAKKLTDILVSLRFIESDQQVAWGEVKKFVGAEPGIRINISTLQPYSPEGRSAEFDNQGGLELVGTNT